MRLFYLTLAGLLTMLSSPSVRADSGEVTVSAKIDNEWALLRHPYHDADGTAPAMHLYVPRFGGYIAYGIHNRLLIGLSGRASPPRSGWAPVFQYLHFDRTEHNEFFMTTRDALATALAQFTLFDGNYMFADIGVEGGLSFRRWRATRSRAAKEPERPLTDYTDTKPSKVIWKRTPYMRASATLRARPWQFLTVAVSPYVATTFSKDISVGATIDIGVPVGAGPGL